MHFSRIPLLWIVVGIITGIILFRYIGFDILPVLILILVAVIFITASKHYAATITISLITGWLTAFSHAPEIPDGIYDKKNTFYGTTTSVREINSGYRLTVKIDSVLIEKRIHTVKNTNIIVNLYDFSKEIYNNQIITFSANLSPNPSPILPGDTDFSNYYYYNDIVGQGFVISGTLCVKGESHSFYASINRLREYLSLSIARSGIDISSVELLNAILLGQTENLNKATRHFFSESGLAHILALSGTHVGIMVSLVFILFIPLRFYGYRISAYLMTVLFIWFYALLTGLTPSVTRASLMLSIVILAHLTGRKYNSLNGLLFSAILILMFRPNDLFNPSFQLSFCAVGAILLLLPFNSEIKPSSNFIKRNINNIISVSFAAIIGTGLLSAYYFHLFPIYGIVSNIPIAVILPVLLSAGILQLLFSIMGIDFIPLVHFIDFLCNALYNIAKFFSSLPYSSIHGLYFSSIVFLPFVLSIILFYIFRITRQRFYAICSSLSFIITFLMVIPDRKSELKFNYYLLSDRYGTELIIHHMHKVWIISSRKNETPNSIIEKIKRNHTGFFESNDIKQLYFIQGNEYDDGLIRYSDGLINIGNDKILAFILSHNDIGRTIPEKSDYTIITCAINDNELKHILPNINSDTVILTSEIHPIAEKRMRLQFGEYGYPVISLRKNRFVR